MSTSLSAHPEIHCYVLPSGLRLLGAIAIQIASLIWSHTHSLKVPCSGHWAVLVITPGTSPNQHWFCLTDGGLGDRELVGAKPGFRPVCLMAGPAFHTRCPECQGGDRPLNGREASSHHHVLGPGPKKGRPHLGDPLGGPSLPSQPL